MKRIEREYDPLGNTWKERAISLSKNLDDLAKWCAVMSDPPHEMWERVAEDLRRSRKAGIL